ncbi:replication-relaxation family protein [Streptomyces sp. NPDC051098]|uniref:replication-relaxation family protein n=1 Tax=Streptomyces sp. NPDC051098 TaxID=3155411 RepID=UPI0034142F92
MTTPHEDAQPTAGSGDPTGEVQPSSEETAVHRAMALLAQHRLVTTLQMQQLLSPGSTRQFTSGVLNTLREAQLVSYAELPVGRTRAWFLTLRGVRAISSWPELRGRRVPALGGPTEASLRAAHTLTVVRSHLAFLHDARRRGDEYGALDWVPEIGHRLPDTGGEDKLIADAVMHYTSVEPDRLQYRAFVEVDRGTMSSERLAAKLISYARFHDYTPQPVGRRGTVADQAAMLAWQRFYPRFPRILFILTGAPEHSLRRRIDDLRAMTAAHPLVNQLAGHVRLGAALLEDLEQHGPTGTVWTPLAGEADRRSWMEL